MDDVVFLMNAEKQLSLEITTAHFVEELLALHQSQTAH